MRPFVEWFAPPQLAANTEPLRSYWVRILRGKIVERQFEALAVDSLACATDHTPPEGCRVTVMPLAEWRAQCAAEAGERARELGIDPRNLTRACDQRAASRELRS